MLLFVPCRPGAKVVASQRTKGIAAPSGFDSRTSDQCAAAAVWNEQIELRCRQRCVRRSLLCFIVCFTFTPDSAAVWWVQACRSRGRVAIAERLRTVQQCTLRRSSHGGHSAGLVGIRVCIRRTELWRKLVGGRRPTRRGRRVQAQVHCPLGAGADSRWHPLRRCPGLIAVRAQRGRQRAC